MNYYEMCGSNQNDDDDDDIETKQDEDLAY